MYKSKLIALFLVGRKKKEKVIISFPVHRTTFSKLLYRTKIKNVIYNS